MTAPRQDLPFEFPFRWTNLREWFKGKGDSELDMETTARMEQRDRDLEDHLASLTSCCSEAFRLKCNSGSSTSSSIVWNDLTADYSYSTSGVSMASGNTGVVVPAGLWDLTLFVEINVATPPTAGQLEVRMFSDNFLSIDTDQYDQIVNPLAYLNCDMHAFVGAGGETIGTSAINNLTGGTPIGFSGRTSMWGHQVCSCDVTFVDPFA